MPTLIQGKKMLSSNILISARTEFQRRLRKTIETTWEHGTEDDRKRIRDLGRYQAGSLSGIGLSVTRTVDLSKTLKNLFILWVFEVGQLLIRRLGRQGVTPEDLKDPEILETFKSMFFPNRNSTQGDTEWEK